MLGIVYVSRAVTAFDHRALNELAALAAKKNATLGVTGYLYYERDRFLQYIEGEEVATRSLMATIRGDKRHDVLSESAHETLPARRFPSWGMRWLAKSELVQIHMEQLLSDHLLLMSACYEADDDWRRITWRMVDTLAKFYQDAHIPRRQ